MNRDTARSVLGGLLSGFGEPGDFGPTDWVNPVHRAIHGAIKRIRDRGDAVDVVLLTRELEPEYREQAGPEVAALFENPVFTAGHYEAHKRDFLRDKRVNDLRNGARVLLGELDKGEASPEVAKVIRRLEELSVHEEKRGLSHIGDGMEELFTHGDKPAVPLGLSCMEPLRVEPGDLCVVAARPGSGKTAMLGTIALEAAIRRWAVLFLSLEMPSLQIRQRLMSGYSGIPLPEVIKADNPRMIDAARDMRNLSVWVEDGRRHGKFRLDLESIVPMVRMFREMNHDRDCVVLLDYLQIVPTRSRFERRYELLGHVCREVKHAALQNNIPIIAAAQLSRAAEQRGKESRPQLSDLRESGEIEQTADQVVLMHRLPEKTMLGVAKYRNGPTFVADARFVGETCRFEDINW